jgi:hypothetical protein
MLTPRLHKLHQMYLEAWVEDEVELGKVFELLVEEVGADAAEGLADEWAEECMDREASR